MNLFHKALAAALLTGAVGFAVPGYAATTDTSSSTGATAAEKSSTNATDANTAAQPAKSARVTRRRIGAMDEEHSIVQALNQKSLEGVQSGQTPDFASAEPASHQQAEAARAAGKTVMRRRTNNKTNVKKGA